MEKAIMIETLDILSVGKTLHVKATEHTDLDVGGLH